jgi:hypothetical protein
MAAAIVLTEIVRLPPEVRARLALVLLRSLDDAADADAAEAWARRSTSVSEPSWRMRSTRSWL